MPKIEPGKDLCPLCGGTVHLTVAEHNGKATTVKARCTACGKTGSAPVHSLPPVLAAQARTLADAELFARLDAGHRATRNIGQG